MARSSRGPPGSGFATAVAVKATSFSGTLTNSGTTMAPRIGNGTATGIQAFGFLSGGLTIANSGTISAADVAINVSAVGLPVEIDQTAGHIIGNTGILSSA